MPDLDNTPPVARDLSAPFANTAPTSRDPGSYAPDNGAPAAVAINLAPTNAQPVARSLATPFDDGAVESRNLAAVANNTAPDSRSPGSYAVEDGAPGTRDLAAPHTNSAPESIHLSAPADNTPATAKAIDQAPVDAAATPKALGDYELANTAPSDASPGDFTPSAAAAVPITGSPLSSISMPASFTPAFVNLTGGGNCLDALSANAGDLGKILQGTVAGELKSYQVRAGQDATALPGIVRPANFDAETNALVFVQL